MVNEQEEVRVNREHTALGNILCETVCLLHECF